MQQRRESYKKAGNDEDRKQDSDANPASSSNYVVHEPPATGLEAMMGLDNMGEMEIPAHLLPGSAHDMGGGGMSEEEMIAAAIQASLAEMNLNESGGAGNSSTSNNNNIANSGNPNGNQISQESYDFLNTFAGGSASSEQLRQPLG